MFTDYGKIAYVKVTELEKKFEEFKKGFSSSTVEILNYDLSTPEKQAVFTKKAYFTAKEQTGVIVSVEVETNLETQMNYRISLNDLVVDSGVSSNGKLSLQLESNVEKGDGVLKVYLSSSMQFNLLKTAITISGKVKHFECDRRLSCVALQDSNYISFLNNKILHLYHYKGNNELESLYEISDVIDGCFGGCINNELYIFYITKEHELRSLIFDTVNRYGFIYDLSARGVTSVGAYPVGNGVKVIFISKNEIYSGIYSKSLVFYYEKTNRRGIKLYTDCDAPLAYVVKSALNSTKLITQN